MRARDSGRACGDGFSTNASARPGRARGPSGPLARAGLALLRARRAGAVAGCMRTRRRVLPAGTADLGRARPASSCRGEPAPGPSYSLPRERRTLLIAAAPGGLRRAVERRSVRRALERRSPTRSAFHTSSSAPGATTLGNCADHAVERCQRVRSRHDLEVIEQRQIGAASARPAARDMSPEGGRRGSRLAGNLSEERGEIFPADRVPREASNSRRSRPVGPRMTLLGCRSRGTGGRA